MSADPLAAEVARSGAAAPARRMTIRSHLLLLALSAVLPVLAFALFASGLLVNHDQKTQRAGTLDRARAMMTAVDTKLRGSITTLQAVSASRSLAADDLLHFTDTARRVLQSQPDWLNLTVALPSGEVAVNVGAPPGMSPGMADDPRSFQRVLERMKPAIGDVVVEHTLGVPAVPVRVPVVRQERIAYVLTALVRPDAFRDLIVQQHLPPDWVSGIVDSNLRFVARVPPQPAGELSSEGFRAAVASGREGWYRGRTVEGTDTFTAHETSSFSGWSIGLATPTATVDGAARRSAWLMAVGALLSIGLAFGATVVIGRRIANPIRSLATVARSLGGGDLRLESPERVQEVSDVAAALRDGAFAVRERQRLLEREKEALQAADSAKNEFLAMLSHELRNPLAAMSSAAQVIKMVEPGHPAAKKARDVIERQTGHMRRLIEDLLDVSRITMGKASLDRHPLDLAQVVSHVVDSWRGSARLGVHPVEMVASPAWADADRARIEQIVANLLDNAVKFTPPAGKITVTVRRDEGAALLAVSDEGEGLAPDLMGRVFDLFVQGEHGIDRGKGGMGVGLALVKRLAEMHGGSASAMSRGRSQGATFEVRFPAIEPAQERPDGRPAPAVTGKARILIIEDNDDAREMLREALSISGHDVESARDGASGLALAARVSPEVALIDIGLPDMDGYEVARRLRSTGAAAISLIALTGYGQAEDRRRAVEAGFDAHLTKPVDSDLLQAAIAGLARPS